MLNIKMKTYAGTSGYTCNPSYSGRKDLEDLGLKPALGKQFMSPYLRKKKNHKKGLLE
jgi:hypothetical protein